MAHDVFISYSTKDKATADGVCATLEAKGIRCWIGPRDILPGMDWGEAIIDAINASRVMILVFSSNANDSLQIKREVERAVSKGLPIMPLRIENVAPARSLEYFIGPVHWLDALTPPLESHLQNLAETVRLLLLRVGKGPGPEDGTQARHESSVTEETEHATRIRTPTPVAEQRHLNGEFERLKVTLGEQMARNAFTEARETVAAIRRIIPTDRDALEAAALIEERLKRPPSQPTWARFKTVAIAVVMVCAIGLGFAVYMHWRPLDRVASREETKPPAGASPSALDHFN